MTLIIHQLLQLFIWITIADIVLSYIPDVRRQKWAQVIRRIADVPQRPIREALPKDIPLDPSPMIVIIVIQILMYLL